jgi:hypothetical protein
LFSSSHVIDSYVEFPVILFAPGGASAASPVLERSFPSPQSGRIEGGGGDSSTARAIDDAVGAPRALGSPAERRVALRSAVAASPSLRLVLNYAIRIST